MGTLGLAAQQACSAINWPGGGVGGNDKEADFQEGYNTGQEDCRATPLECGVKLGDMIKDQGYGETEPNDHIINADGLLLGQFYHANSSDQVDEDWYYVTTDRKNQKLTVYFLGDSGNYAATEGWVIKVHDLKGNVIAAFDSATSGGAGIEGGPAEGGSDTSPVEAAKITEVTLGKIGSYYITVRSKDDAGMLRGYHIGATLKDTGQVTAIEEENRFDTETEPNDDKKHADPLRSNVAMAGVFDRTLIKYEWVTTPAKTEYRYFYKLCDQTNPGTVPSGATNCTCDIKKYPVSPNNPNFKLQITGNNPVTYTAPGNTDNTLDPAFDADPTTAGVQVPPYTLDDGGTPNNPSDDEFELAPADACEAKAFTTPEKTEKRGKFHYDKDVYVYHSEGDEQLRVQICTRTECEFDRVHLRISKDDTSIVLLDGPIEPGQVIDMGAALPGDYYFVFSPEETGVDSETGDPEVENLVGPYDILLMSTRLSPSGGTVPTSANPPEQPKKPKPTKKNKNDTNKNSGSGSGNLPLLLLDGLLGD